MVFIRQIYYTIVLDIFKLYRYLLLCEIRYLTACKWIFHCFTLLSFFTFFFISSENWWFYYTVPILCTFVIMVDIHDYEFFAFYKKWEMLVNINITTDSLVELPYGRKFLSHWDEFRFIFLFNIFIYFLFTTLNPTLTVSIFYQNILYIDSFSPLQLFFINIFNKFCNLCRNDFSESKLIYKFTYDTVLSKIPFALRYDRMSCKHFFLKLNISLYRRRLYMDWRAKAWLLSFYKKFTKWRLHTLIENITYTKRFEKVLLNYYQHSVDILKDFDAAKYANTPFDYVTCVYYLSSWSRRAPFLRRFYRVIFYYKPARHFLRKIFFFWISKWSRRTYNVMRWVDKLPWHRRCYYFRHFPGWYGKVFHMWYRYHFNFYRYRFNKFRFLKKFGWKSRINYKP